MVSPQSMLRSVGPNGRAPEWARARKGNGSDAHGFVPAAEIAESADEIRITIEVPGLTSADVEILLENGVLTISGEKRPTLVGSGDGKARVRRERRFGRFRRSFALPRGMDGDRIDATITDGVLRVTLPKHERTRSGAVRVRGAGTPELTEPTDGSGARPRRRARRAKAAAGS